MRRCWIPRGAGRRGAGSEGSLGEEPTDVQACACGATFRNGLVVEAGGKMGLGPYPTQSCCRSMGAEMSDDPIEQMLEEIRHDQEVGRMMTDKEWGPR